MAPARLAGGQTLFTQAHEPWAQLQPALSPEFRKRSLDPRLAELGGLIDDEIGALPLDTTIDLDQAMGRLTLIVATWVLFGQRLGRERADELGRHQRVLIDWVGHRLGLLRASLPVAVGRSAREMRKHRDALYAYAGEIIDARRREGRSHHDVLDALLAARPNGKALSEADLRSQVVGFFTAGNETTASALGWAMVHGGAHPSDWATVRTDPGAARAYVDETLRLSPPGWVIGRSPTRAGVGLTVRGSQLGIPRSQAVMIYVRGMNRDPDRWPDPATFLPARQHSLTREQDRGTVPFGLGPRGCIGQQLAMAEMIAVLPILASRGDLHVEGESVEDPTFTLRVRGGLRGRFTLAATS